MKTALTAFYPAYNGNRKNEIMNLIQQLPDGPLDIVGDVHGEIGALRALLGHLDYRDDGSHPDDRRVVFVGDLVDRGPDSPAVLELVMRLVREKHAYCVLGNHDLNLLLDERRVDNNWWNEPGVNNPQQRPVREEDKSRFREFVASLPLVLHRRSGKTPIRIVHAAWDDESLGRLDKDAGRFQTIKELHDHYKAEITDRWNGTEDAVKWEEEEAQLDKINPSLSATGPRPDYLDAHARKDSDLQSGNPVKVITSGLEHPVEKEKLFKAGHKWRFVQRDAWWNKYRDKTPIIIGHYWRYLERAPGYSPEKNGPDLFEGTRPLEWLGKNKKSVYCVDFGVGGRSSKPPQLKNYFNLAALRVPEWEIVLDRNGTRQCIGPPNSLS